MVAESSHSFTQSMGNIGALNAIVQNKSISDTLKIDSLISHARAAGYFIYMDLNLHIDQGLMAVFKEVITTSVSKNYLFNKLENMGIQNSSQFNYADAIHWHSLQSILADSLNYMPAKISALNNLGQIYLRLDNYEFASKVFQDAHQLSLLTNNVIGMVQAKHGLGNLYLQLTDYSEALQCFKDCLRIEQKANNMQGVAANLDCIGQTYFGQKNIEKALEYFLISLEINSELGLKQQLAINYNNIGDVYVEKHEWEKGLHYYLFSMQLNTSIDDKYYLAINNYQVALVLVAQQKYTEALPYVMQAIDLSKKTNNRSNLAGAYHLMYKISKANGKLSQSFQFLELSKGLSDSLMNENIQKIIFQTQATFNRQLSEKQIQLLQNEKQIGELRIKRQNYFTNMTTVGLILLFLAIVILLLALKFKVASNRNLKEKNKEIHAASIKLSEYSNELLLAKKEAEKSNILKSQFLANMSHEIRTPLNSVIGFSEILSKHINDPAQRAYLDSIQLSGKNLLLLIDDILDLSKIELDKLNSEFHSIELSVLCWEIRQVFSLQAAQKNIKFEVFIDSIVPKIIHSNESSIRQILHNLVGNAIKFTSHGTVKLIITAVPLQVDDAFDVHIEVSDTGIGIEADEIEYIFDPFYQSTKGSASEKGNGLGLSITKRLVTNLNGEISVQRNGNKGTKFCVLLKSVKGTVMRTSLRVPSPAMEYGSLSKIALISSDLSIQVLINDILENTEQTCDVFEQIDTFNQIETHYELLLLDAKVLAKYRKNKTFNQFLAELSQRTRKTACLYNNNVEVDKLETSGFNFLIQLEENLGLLQTTIRESITQQSDTIKKPIEKIVDKESKYENLDNLVALFEMAYNSHILSDCRAFADELTVFGLVSNNPFLSDLGNMIQENVDTFNVEKLIVNLNTCKSFFDALNQTKIQNNVVSS